jgi:hypothetical protein
MSKGIESWVKVQLVLSDESATIDGTKIAINEYGISIIPSAANTKNEFYPFSALLKIVRLD